VDPSRGREPQVRRRTVLGGTAAIVLAAPLSGCTGDDDSGSAAAPDSTVTPAPTTAAPEGDAALAAGALGEEQALLDFCTKAARQGARQQRAALQAVRNRQRAIVGALTDAMTDPEATSHPPIAVPRRRRAMLRELTASLAAAEETRLADCLAAESGPFARLLASVSASHAVAVEQVRALR
jgi:hypothetical protein